MTQTKLDSKTHQALMLTICERCILGSAVKVAISHRATLECGEERDEEKDDEKMNGQEEGGSPRHEMGERAEGGDDGKETSQALGGASRTEEEVDRLAVRLGSLCDGDGGLVANGTGQEEGSRGNVVIEREGEQDQVGLEEGREGGSGCMDAGEWGTREERKSDTELERGGVVIEGGEQRGGGLNDGCGDKEEGRAKEGITAKEGGEDIESAIRDKEHRNSDRELCVVKDNKPDLSQEEISDADKKVELTENG